jgi:hypothetical protein
MQTPCARKHTLTRKHAIARSHGHGHGNVATGHGTRVHLRWLREWLASQAAAGVLEWTEAADGQMRYSLAPEMREVLLDNRSPSYQGGFIAMSEAVLNALPAAEKSFTTGIG